MVALAATALYEPDEFGFSVGAEIIASRGERNAVFSRLGAAWTDASRKGSRPLIRFR